MARYLFRLSILGPTLLDAARIDAALAPVWEHFGFGSEPPTITNVKGLAPPALVAAPDLPLNPGDPTDPPVWVVQVPPWGPIELDETAKARNVNTLTQASIVLEGTLPPDTTSSSGGVRTGRFQVSSEAFRALNAAFGAGGFYVLTGAQHEAGLVAVSSRSTSFVGFLALAGVAIWAMRQSSGLHGLGRTAPLVEAERLRKRAQRYRHEGRHVEARRLERLANRIASR